MGTTNWLSGEELIKRLMKDYWDPLRVNNLIQVVSEVHFDGAPVEGLFMDDHLSGYRTLLRIGGIDRGDETNPNKTKTFQINGELYVHKYVVAGSFCMFRKFEPEKG